ncbi:MAG: Flp pilus assembly complex ATPase component TadA [Alphaproteobacteria bacterium]|nr:Flp pilus assembly complex ATPase component TadA [Alphaproteobacteria bacterium]
MKKLLQYNFSDLYINADKEFYISDECYKNSLKKVEPTDKEEFCHELFSTIHQDSSYSLIYKGTYFRVESSITVSGELWCLRRMPDKVPSIYDLGFNHRLVQYLVSLFDKSGLILWSGATGQGKTTSIASLLVEYLNVNGGFAYTIEDPAEMPLEGEYKAINGSVGFCRQIEVKNDDWKSPLKSALRSHPRYIFIGEIRTPDAAQECLRAAISGHVVLATIHAGTLTDAINSIVKYASFSMSETSAYDILSRGLLAVINQELVGVGKERHPSVEVVFANPELNKADTVRSIIRSGTINLATIVERQSIKLSLSQPIFDE